MKKIIINFFPCVAALFLVWLFLSWCDVVTDNLQERPEHSNLNAFAVLVEIAEGVHE